MVSKIERLKRDRDELFRELQLMKTREDETHRDSLDKILELKNQVQLISGENDRLLETLDELKK